MDRIGQIILAILGTSVLLMMGFLAVLLVYAIVEQHRDYARLRRLGISLPPGPTPKERATGVFMLFTAAFLGWGFVNVEGRPLWLGILMAAPLTTILGAVGWGNLFLRRDSSLPRTMAYFDFFGRISEESLAKQRGPLALAARVLHQNVQPLKGAFTVVTTAGDHRTAFPRGYDDLASGYVALVANREPVGLFFHHGLALPFRRVLSAKVMRYELSYGSESRIFPKSTEGYAARRRRRRWRLDAKHLTEADVQRIIDVFVEEATR